MPIVHIYWHITNNKQSIHVHVQLCILLTYLLIRVGFYNKTAADSLRASLAQITSDLSTYSLNESDTVRDRERETDSKESESEP